MQNKIMEFKVDDINEDKINIEDLEVEALKMKLIERKVRKSIKKDEDGTYYLDDTNFSYLKDCLNLTFPDTFTYEDLGLVMKVKEIPKNNTITLDNVIEITLNGILDYKKEDIIILEPLKDINKVTRLSYLDTRIKNNITLSSEAIILINYENKLNTKLYQDYKIIRYSGDLKVVLDKLLIFRGIRPQHLIETGFENNENNEILHNYLMKNYPSKLTIDVLGSLEERQKKELSVRDEVLSIIRKGRVLVLDDIDIASNELVLLAEHYKNTHIPNVKDLSKTDFKDFVNIYGVRISSNGIYLLEEDNIAAKGYADTETIDTLYNIYLKNKKNYKDRLGYLNNRKKILSSIYEDDVKLVDKRKISDIDLDSLYREYQKTENFDGSVKKFMQDVGVRINDNEIYLLSDDEAINLIDFIDSQDEDRIAIFLRDNFEEDCYTEDEKNLGIKLKGGPIKLSFDGLEGIENYFQK